MGLIEDLIELNRKRAAAGEKADRPPLGYCAGSRVRRKRRRPLPDFLRTTDDVSKKGEYFRATCRVGVTIEATEQRIAKVEGRKRRRTTEHHRAAARAARAGKVRLRRKKQIAALKEWRRRRLGKLKEAGWKPARSKGAAGVDTYWVGFLVRMQPGQWYGASVLDRMHGRHKALHLGPPLMKLFLERRANPKWVPGETDKLMSRIVRGSYVGVLKGTYFEPRWLYRLSPWGVALRTKVLDDPTCKVVPNMFELDGARPDLWEAMMVRKRRSAARLQKSRGGLPGGASFGENSLASQD